MQVEIHSNGFSLTDGIRDYAKRRLQFVLNRTDKHITRIQVRLADINGPRGGIDKRCQIDLTLAGRNHIIVEDTETDLYVAIDRASDRCERTLARHLERAREFRPKPLNSSAIQKPLR